jgi:hypothetical protein
MPWWKVHAALAALSGAAAVRFSFVWWPATDTFPMDAQSGSALDACIASLGAMLLFAGLAVVTASRAAQSEAGSKQPNLP